MLRTPPRSTLHSAVCLKFAETVHCPPFIERSVFRPSTACPAPYLVKLKGYCCHADLPNAMFSENNVIVILMVTCRQIKYNLMFQCPTSLLLNNEVM